jgi:hypothetical protein
LLAITTGLLALAAGLALTIILGQVQTAGR